MTMSLPPYSYGDEYDPTFNWHSFYTSREFTYRLHQRAIHEAGKGIVAVPGQISRGKNFMVRVTESPKYNIKLYQEIFNRVELCRSIIFRLAELVLSVDKDVRPPASILRDNRVIDDDMNKNISFIRKWKRHKKFDTWLFNALVCSLWAGNSYTEVVYEKENEKRSPGRPKFPGGWKIHELKILPPDEMRPIRNSHGDILGYIQYPFQGTYSWLNKDNAHDFEKAGGVIFKPDEIIHIKLDPAPGEAYGTSKIESIKDILAIIVGMREDIGVIVKNYAAPTILFRVGTDLIPASAATVTAFQSNLQSQMAVSSNIVTSTAVDGKVIDTAKAVMNMEGYFKMMVSVLFGAFGVPEIMLGQGQETTEATAKMQLEAVSNQLKVMHQVLKDEIDLKLFGYLSVNKRYTELTPGDLDKIPELWFGPLETTEDKRLRYENMFRFEGCSREEWRQAYGMKPKYEGELISTGNIKFQKQVINATAEANVKVAAARPAAGTQSGSNTKDKPTQKKSDRDAEHGRKAAATTNKKK